MTVSHENLTHQYLIAKHAIGDLMPYGAVLTDLFHRSAGYIDRIQAKSLD
jgi:hypothetical protein